MQSQKATATAWWVRANVEPELGNLSANKGLDSYEANKLLGQFGPNTLYEGSRNNLLRQFLSRFKNPLVLILLAASAVSALMGELTNFVIITLIVLLSVTADFVQEHRANLAAEKLR